MLALFDLKLTNFYYQHYKETNLALAHTIITFLGCVMFLAESKFVKKICEQFLILKDIPLVKFLI